MKQTAYVFQQQQNGSFLGVEVRNNGGIGDLGQTLLMNYQDKETLEPIISKGKTILMLSSPTMIDFKDVGLGMIERETRTIIHEQSDTVWYYAETKNDIRDQAIYPFVNFKQLSNFIHEEQYNDDNSRPYTTLKASAFIYIQMNDGTWYVTCTSSKTGMIRPFELLEEVDELLTAFSPTY